MILRCLIHWFFKRLSLRNDFDVSDPLIFKRWLLLKTFRGFTHCCSNVHFYLMILRLFIRWVFQSSLLLNVFDVFDPLNFLTCTLTQLFLACLSHCLSNTLFFHSMSLRCLVHWVFKRACLIKHLNVFVPVVFWKFTFT